jgi:hypothetical protein
MPTHHVLYIYFWVMDCQEGYDIEVWRQLLMSSERDEFAQELVADLVARILQVG